MNDACYLLVENERDPIVRATFSKANQRMLIAYTIIIDNLSLVFSLQQTQTNTKESSDRCDRAVATFSTLRTFVNKNGPLQILLFVGVFIMIARE
jgi:hypothetical protein